MQFHQLSSKTKLRKGHRVGRGGKRGTYSGRGIKGQRARAGAKFRPQERDILKKIPKLRGYRFKSFRPRPAVINLHMIEKRFHPGETVSPASLIEKGMITRINGKTPKVKVLGHGELKKQIIFEDVLFSKTAAAKFGSHSTDRKARPNAAVPSNS